MYKTDCIEDMKTEIEQAIRNAQEYEARDAKGYGNFEAYAEASQLLTKVQKQVSRIKPDRITDEQAEELKAAKNELEQSASAILQ